MATANEDIQFRQHKTRFATPKLLASFSGGASDHTPLTSVGVVYEGDSRVTHSA